MGGGTVYKDLRERGYVSTFSFYPPSHSVLSETASFLCWGLQYKLQENIYGEKRKE